MASLSKLTARQLYHKKLANSINLSFFFRAVEFFKQVLKAYSLKYMKASRMLGDQLALAWVVKSHLPSALRKFSKHEIFTGEVNGASVLFLPCAVYNWTPPEGAGQFHGMPLDVKVQHFSYLLGPYFFINAVLFLFMELFLVKH